MGPPAAACLWQMPHGAALGATMGARLPVPASARQFSMNSRGFAAAAASAGGGCGSVGQHGLGLRSTPHVRQGACAWPRTRCGAAKAAPAPAADQGTATPPPQQSAAPLSREEHNNLQAEAFSDPARVQRSLQPPDEEMQKRLERIAAAVPGLGPASKVIDVGCGAGALIPYLQAQGVRDILAVDLAQPMLDAVAQQHPPPSSPDTELGVRTWCGDIVDLPAAEGPVDAVFFKSSFAHMHNQHAALWAACRLLRPGGHIVLAHPLGRFWSSRLTQQDPKQVPHILPGVAELQQLNHDLPLHSADARSLRNSLYPDGSLPDGMYLRVLQVPEGYVFDNMYYNWNLIDTGTYRVFTHDGFKLRRQPQPIVWKAEVITGFGSRQKGLLPMANLDTQDCRRRLAQCFDLPGDPVADAITPRLWQMPAGMYFGFAKLDRGSNSGRPDADFETCSMIMSISEGAAQADDASITVEVHICDHEFSSDFIGLKIYVQVCGFLRPELELDDTSAQLAQLNTDIDLARVQLALPVPQKWKQSGLVFQHADDPIAKLQREAAARCQPQGASQASQLPVNMYDVLLYNKVADVLNAQPKRNKLATFSAVAKALDIPVTKVTQAVRAAGSRGITAGMPDVHEETLDAAAHSAFLDNLAYLVGDDIIKNIPQGELRERMEAALASDEKLYVDILRYRYSAQAPLGRPLTRNEVADLHVPRIDIKRVRQIELNAIAFLKDIVQKGLQ